ncbi:complex I assembly factor ACAD9, mitochondrial [Drosophila albomicans]|uniref:Complex I assembly factor ACAD9, mitochondrial n=1 Tax=Drosophila albomicans TaxID=7291 RepID=A0A6P8X5E0_DROAB|nr:complex I assembly factor ACAD9, mitochondrial [Drosophila albomicans]
MRYSLLSRAVKLLNENHSRRGQILLTRSSSNKARSELNAQHAGQQQEEVTKAAEETGKLPAREPLAKNFFVGLTDRELLGYPEVIPRDEMANLQNALLPLNNYFAEEQQQEQETQLKQLGLYGLNVPTDYEGRGYKWSASLMASEPEAQHTSLALGLQTHRVVVDLLCELGSLEQQERYLPQLASGQLVASEAILEYTPPEDDFFATQAQYDADRRCWLLTGEKAFVLTAPAGQRQLFLVLAQTQQPNVPGTLGRSSTIFLVDSQQQGVRLGEAHETFGCQAASMRRIHFDQVQLTEEQLLGLPHEGNRYAEQLVRSSRLRGSLTGIVLAKRLLQQLASFSVDTQQCGVQLKDLELTRVQLSQATCSIYAMESMLYMTAGLLDEFAGQDVTLESSITKYYTLQQLYTIASQSLTLLGPQSLHRGQFWEQGLRDAAQLCTQGESLSTLSLFIALTGLQHAGQQMNEGVRKSRNPLYNPGHIFGKFLSTNTLEQPKTRMLLAENLHPTLESAAQCIEHSVARLHMAVDLMFTKHGNAVVERQHEMQRLANIVSTIYAMWSSVARASRSYCIGLPLADHEMLTASAICTQGRDDVLRLATEIYSGNYVNNDNNLLRLASQVTKSKGYFAVHPLTFNF